MKENRCDLCGKTDMVKKRDIPDDGEPNGFITLNLCSECRLSYDRLNGNDWND